MTITSCLDILGDLLRTVWTLRLALLMTGASAVMGGGCSKPLALTPKDAAAQAETLGSTGGTDGAGENQGTGGASTTGGTNGMVDAVGTGGVLAGGTIGSGGTAKGGAGDGAAGGSSGTTSKSAVLEPMINAFCAAARSCCANQGTVANLADCETKFASRHPTIASVDSGDVTVDSAALAACIVAYENARTDCNGDLVVQACQGVYVGTKSDGQRCSNDVAECLHDQGPIVCLLPSGATGVCKLIPHGKSGDPCLTTCQSGKECSFTDFGEADAIITMCFEQDGFYCDTSDNPTCKPIVPLGGSCDGNNCGPSAFCDKGGTCNTLCSIADCTTPRSLTNATVCLGYAPAP
jgi:hypothetical protein